MVHSQTKRKKQTHQKKLPEIVVQDFGEDMFDLGTPKDVEHMYKFVLSPRQSPAAATKWSSGLDLPEKLDIPYNTNSCVLLSPSPSLNTRRDCENWDAVFQANGAEDLLNGPEKKLTDDFLTELGLKSPHSKVTLFSPKFPDNLFSVNFLKEIGLDHGEVTLVSPKEANMISTKTPVVVKRQNEGKCELGIYLPPCYTPALVDSIRSTINEEDLTMFPFPPVSDDSVSDCSHLEDVEDMDIDLPPNAPNFFSCIQNAATTKASSSIDAYNTGNTGMMSKSSANMINNNNQSMINNNNTNFNNSNINMINNNNNNVNMMSNNNNNSTMINNNTGITNPNNTMINNHTTNMINNHSNQPNHNNHHRMFAQPGPCNAMPTSMHQGITLPGNFDYTSRLSANHNQMLTAHKPSGRRPKTDAKERRAKLTELRKQFKEVRILHNDVERKRRGEMHSKFQKLRESIPEIETDKKAAKITILKVAKRFIKELDGESKKMEEIKEYEKSRNRELLSRLCNLTGTTAPS